MEIASITARVEYNEDGFMSEIKMSWDGDSDFVKASRELVEDNIFDPIKRSDVCLGMRVFLGPFKLKLISINTMNDMYLFKLDNEIVKNSVYLGSIQNEWNWELIKENK